MYRHMCIHIYIYIHMFVCLFIELLVLVCCGKGQALVGRVTRSGALQVWVQGFCFRSPVCGSHLCPGCQKWGTGFWVLHVLVHSPAQGTLRQIMS